MSYRIVVILILVAIVVSLGSALYYLVVDQGRSERVVRALTFRVILSLALVLLLLIGLATGLLTPPL